MSFGKKNKILSAKCQNWKKLCFYKLDFFVNLLAPGRFQFNIRKVIFKLTLVNGGWGISYEIALR